MNGKQSSWNIKLNALKSNTLVNKGIILIALGRKYNELAYNLIKSVKVFNPELKFAVITDTAVDEFLLVYDEVIIPETKHYIEDGHLFNPFMLKTYLYDYSPFDETIYLDVDAVCLKDISGLFSEFKIQEVGRFKKDEKTNSVWFKSLEELFSAYELKNEYPEYNSSFISFSRCKRNEEYFDLVKKLYRDRRIPFIKIGCCYPDELAFGIASSMLNWYSDNGTSLPICFWWEQANVLKLSEIKERFFFIGLAGGYISSKYLGYYHSILKNLGSPFWKVEMKNKIFHKK